MSRFVVLVLLLLLPSYAMAQRPCDQSRASITTGAVGPIEKVTGDPKKRVYICGYIIMPVAPPPGGNLEFQLTTGTGNACATNNVIIMPRMLVPTSGIVNRIAWASEATPAGHSVCLQTWGTGAVTSVFYWAQF